MLTIFSVPKSFEGHINIIQRNAIKSWLQLRPECEIILFGDDAGVAETAQEFNIKHISEIKKNEFGTPLLNSAFDITQKLAKNNILVYINTDIILTKDFISTIQQIKFSLFLMIGRRWDLDIKEEIDFDQNDWEKELRKEISKKGKLHGFSGIDYFIFPRNFSHQLPCFAVGRVGYDNWLVYHARSIKVPVIDASQRITIIHQNHDYSHSRFGKKERVEGPEFKKNIELAGGTSCMCTIRDANWIFNKEGLKKPKLFRRIFSKLSLFYPWRALFSFKRKIREFL